MNKYFNGITVTVLVIGAICILIRGHVLFWGLIPVSIASVYYKVGLFGHYFREMIKIKKLIK